MTARASASASFAPSAHSSCSPSEASANATTRDATTVARADSAALSAARSPRRHVARSENASSSSSSSRLPNRREAWPSPPENDAHARATTSASAATPGLTKSSARNARAPAAVLFFLRRGEPPRPLRRRRAVSLDPSRTHRRARGAQRAARAPSGLRKEEERSRVRPCTVVRSVALRASRSVARKTRAKFSYSKYAYESKGRRCRVFRDLMRSDVGRTCINETERVSARRRDPPLCPFWPARAKTRGRPCLWTPRRGPRASPS